MPTLTHLYEAAKISLENPALATYEVLAAVRCFVEAVVAKPELDPGERMARGMLAAVRKSLQFHTFDQPANTELTGELLIYKKKLRSHLESIEEKTPAEVLHAEAMTEQQVDEVFAQELGRHLNQSHRGIRAPKRYTAGADRFAKPIEWQENKNDDEDPRYKRRRRT